MKPIWLFDLDNTLHDASARIFPHINRSMTHYVMAELGLEEREANALREYYWRRYGATLQGLMRHHGIDPHHFLRTTHDFPALERMVIFDRTLAGVLGRLPGRKYIFSNGPARYAQDVLAVMGLRRHFDGVFAIEDARFSPKPGMSAYRRLLHRYRLNPADCVMVEDTAENLRSARRLGIRTVLVGPGPGKPSWVDIRVRSVRALPRRMGP